MTSYFLLLFFRFSLFYKKKLGGPFSLNQTCFPNCPTPGFTEKLGHHERVGQHLAPKLPSPSCSHTPNKTPITSLPDPPRELPGRKRKGKKKEDKTGHGRFSEPQLRDLLEIRGLTVQTEVMLIGERRGEKQTEGQLKGRRGDKCRRI